MRGGEGEGEREREECLFSDSTLPFILPEEYYKAGTQLAAILQSPSWGTTGLPTTGIPCLRFLLNLFASTPNFLE